jgi:hypothetical protein
MANITLKYEEEIYDVEFKNINYKLSVIFDWESGDFEFVIMKYNRKGELVVPTEKQRESVINYFNNNK